MNRRPRRKGRGKVVTWVPYDRSYDDMETGMPGACSCTSVFQVLRRWYRIVQAKDSGMVTLEVVSCRGT